MSFSILKRDSRFAGKANMLKYATGQRRHHHDMGQLRALLMDDAAR